MAENPELSFLRAGGATGADMLSHDWSGFPLGEPETWPAVLRIALGLILASPESMYLVWGQDLLFFFNDAYRPILGPRLARAIGTTLPQLWPDAWDAVRPMVEKTFAGEASRFEDLPIGLAREGVREDTWWTFSYSPLRDETGTVVGLFCVTNETTQKVRSVEALIASETRNRQILDSAVDYAIVATDLQGRITRWNAGAHNVLGWRESEMLGETAHRLFTPEDVARGQIETEMRNALATGRGNDVRWHLRKGDEPFWAVGETTLLRDDAGNATGFLKVLRDRTAERLAEEAEAAREAALREALSLNTLILNSSRDCIVVLDLLGNTQLVSAGGIEAMEITDVGAILGLSWIRVWKGDGNEAARRAVAEAAAGGIGRFRGFCPTHKGTPKWWDVVISPLPGPDGRPERLVSVGRDITDQKQAEAALRDLNESLELRVAERTAERDQIWRTSLDLLCVATFDGRLAEINPAWGHTLGWTDAELKAAPFLELVHPDDVEPTTAAMSVLLDGGSVTQFENRYRHKDGSWRWLSWNSVPHRGKVYAVVRDVTDQKAQAAALARAEEQLRQSQKLEAVGQLTGGVAHDFNNLLTVIRGAVDMLRRPDISVERRTRYMEAISDTVTRAAKLTGQLLAFARRQALQPSVFDVGRSVEGVVDMVNTLTGTRIRVDTHLAPEACFVDADPSQFETALVNMAVNARDAMEGEGRLTITVERVNVIPPVRSHLAVEGDFVAVRIADTGIGIALDLLERIFEPFFTTKDVGQGTGLGLSQVFGFAKQSGGEVRAESEVGVGTTMILYLPRASREAEAVQEVSPEPLVDGHGTCVLVVEDNPDVGSFAAQSLKDLGYDSVLATNAVEALAELAKDAERFDVVFSDVVMPGMNGIELGAEIRRLHPRMPVVLTSGYSHVLARSGSGGFVLLHKPYSVEQLSKVLRKVGRRRDAGSASPLP